jgi:hypothetical protein
MSFQFKTKSKGNYSKTIKKQIQDGKVKVGLPKGKSGEYEDGMTVIEVGAMNEFGTARIPERSFIRVPLQQNKEKYFALAKKEIKKIYLGKQTVDNALGLLGLFVSDKMKGSFTNNNWDANADSTVKMKGSSRPLIDTGQLLNSITWIKVNKS